VLSDQRPFTVTPQIATQATIGRYIHRCHDRPYLVWMMGLGLDACLNGGLNFTSMPKTIEGEGFMTQKANAKQCGMLDYVLRSRADVRFLGWDLSDHSHLKGMPLPGIVMPPMPKVIITNDPWPSGPTQHFLTFRGRSSIGMYGSSRVRLDIFRSSTSGDFDRAAIQLGLPNGSVIIERSGGSTYLERSGVTKHYTALQNTTFGLAPRGDNRWSYRLSELIASCIVPVVIADGSSVLPFEPLINWSGAAVVVPEATAARPYSLLAQLPLREVEQQAMRRRVCEIYQKHMSSFERVWSTVLQALSVQLRSVGSGKSEDDEGLGTGSESNKD